MGLLWGGQSGLSDRHIPYKLNEKKIVILTIRLVMVYGAEFQATNKQHMHRMSVA